MDSHDFTAWISKLCVLEQRGDDKEFVEAVRSFAGELGVDIPTDEDLAEWFTLDDGSLTPEYTEETLKGGDH